MPAPVVRSLDDIQDATQSADTSIARSGETQRQGDWRDELLKTGIRAKGKQRIDFSRVEPLAGTRWLHADAETKESKPATGCCLVRPGNTRRWNSGRLNSRSMRRRPCAPNPK